LSTGDVLRTNIEKCSELGIEAESYIKKGQLVPDESMINVIMHEMKDIKGSFLLDGFPRTRVQAEKLDKVQKIDCVINLVVPYDIIIGKSSSIMIFIFHIPPPHPQIASNYATFTCQVVAFII
jgi:nucleoside-triphosphate--adenylate kinase